MSRFAAAPRVPFGRQQGTAVEQRVLARNVRRRAARVADVAGLVAAFPAVEGEAVHALVTARFDLTLALALFVERHGPAEMRVATLSFSEENLGEMTRLLDAGHLTRLTLLASTFWSNFNKDLFALSREEFSKRGQHIAAHESHAKVATIALASGGKLSVEGSANLRSNSGLEQVAVYRHAELHDFHAGWIKEQVEAHEGDEGDEVGDAEG